MAQISLISGSPFVGCPIVYEVQPASYDQSRTFHRIVLRVYAQLEGDDAFTEFDFSEPVLTKASGQTYVTQPSQFDIHLALQAVAEKYEYTPQPPERYPYIKFRVEAWDEWMVNGVVSTNQNKAGWPSLPDGTNTFYAYAFMGAFNDLERLDTQVDGSGVEYLDITYLSRKPNTSPEIVFKDVPFIYPEAFYRGLDVDHLTGGANPTFESAEPTQERTATEAYRYDNISGQSTSFATNGSIVLLVYNDIEEDDALKVCHVEPQGIDPITGLPTGGGISWTFQKANLGDFYAVQSDGNIYVATATGWVMSSGIGPKPITYTPTAVGAEMVDGHSLYVINKPTNGYELRFVNGMGCLESVCATTFAKKEANIHTERYTIARQETLKKFSRMMTVKTDDKEVWTMVSGPLDEAWASWYVHEFLKAQWMWIKMGSHWIPCHVMPEETETIIDQEKAQMPQVQFKIELDLVY